MWISVTVSSSLAVIHRATGGRKLLGDTSKQSVRFCSPNVPRQRICNAPNVGIVQSPCITYFSKSLKVAIEQLLFPVIISSDGKSEVGIHTQVVLLFQH